MGRLDGKVAFLTGAGAGIAKASAKALVREGAKVAILEINRDAGKAAEQEIVRAGGEAVFIETDVTDDASVKRAVAAVIERYGKLDIIVNCAGGSLAADVPVHEMDLEIWHRTIRLNLLHPFLCCRHGIPHLIKAGGGAIINFASVLGQIGSERPAYAAAKGGIVSFTKTLAAQYAQYGIRANAIAPGGIRTERTASGWDDNNPAAATDPRLIARKLLVKNYPFSRGEPEDIAGVVVFLASNESRMFTGTTLDALGGRTSYLKLGGD